MHWETKKYVWLSLLPVLFTMVVWNQTRNISEAWLRGHVVALQLLSHVQVFVTPWNTAHQAPLSSTMVWRCSLKSVMLSKHLMVCSLFSSCPRSFPESGSFPLYQLWTSCGQNIGASTWASVLPMNIQSWFPLVLTGLISMDYKGLSKSSPAPQFSKPSVLQCSAFFMADLSHPVHHYWKTHSFD